MLDPMVDVVVVVVGVVVDVVVVLGRFPTKFPFESEQLPFVQVMAPEFGG